MVRAPREAEVVEQHGLPLRRLRRADQLRALTHPRRIDLLDLLMASGPLTASECAERLGDSPASCSYHLRQLARFGFVEEAPGGTGRNRPWRWVPMGNTVELGGSPSEEAASEALTAVLDARTADRIRRYRGQRGRDPWRRHAMTSDWTIRVTESELADLNDAISALLAPLQRRTNDGVAPEGSRLVDVFTHLLPRPEGSGDEDA